MGTGERLLERRRGATRVWGPEREEKEVGHPDQISIFFQRW